MSLNEKIKECIRGYKQCKSIYSTSEYPISALIEHLPEIQSKEFKFGFNFLSRIDGVMKYDDLRKTCESLNEAENPKLEFYLKNEHFQAYSKK